MMRTPRFMRDLEDVRRTAEHPDRLDALRSLIEDEQGYALYRAVSDAKAALSSADAVTLRFAHERLVLDQVIERADFERWIAADLARLGQTIDAALADAGLAAGRNRPRVPDRRHGLRARRAGAVRRALRRRTSLRRRRIRLRSLKGSR